MKIILSRKGFDSANGGIVSPIFEDGTMVSFPIPSDDEDTYDSLYYNGIQYSQILRDLRYKGGDHCHLDPDLDLGRRRERIDGWFPAFGQRNAAAAYLKNTGSFWCSAYWSHDRCRPATYADTGCCPAPMFPSYPFGSLLRWRLRSVFVRRGSVFSFRTI